MSFRLLMLSAAFVLIGAGCGTPPAEPMDPAVPITPSSTERGVQESRTTWAATRIPLRGIVFTPPQGYWVYFYESANMYLLVPGEPPSPDAPDPKDVVVEQAVGSFAEIRTDPASFPTWERFELTVAQFSCPEISTPEDPLACTDQATIIASDVDRDMPYRAFSLPLQNRDTGVRRGSRTFVVLRQSRQSDFGFFFRIPDPKNLPAILALVRSMRVE